MAEAAALAGLGWVVSPAVKELINKGISYLGSNITEGLDDLETTLVPQIQLTIEAAQQLAPNKKDLFAKWLSRLKKAYYDAEAMLHDLEYKRLKREAEGEANKLLVCLSSKPILKPLIQKASLLSSQNRELSKRLNKLKKVAAEAETLRQLLGIQNTGSTSGVIAGNNRIVTSYILTDKRVFGRDRDCEEIINFLLNEQGSSSSTKGYSVVAITGIGGIGKTTLAQYVYNDQRVKNHFGVRMWLCLSQKIDIIERTKELIVCATEMPCPDVGNCLSVLQSKLETLSKSGNTMLVLDDVWYDNNDSFATEQIWEILLAPFASDCSRRGTCTIVVTSRSTTFPSKLKPDKHIVLSDLPYDDFQSLLRYCAIGVSEIDNPQSENKLLRDIVDQIAKKMSKSPLAAKVVGNQLHKNINDTSFWRNALEKVDLSDTRDILLWSFHRFDVKLQRCFLFCSVFPKGTIFDLHTLIPYWIALDFIRPSDHNKSGEDVGLEYFQIMLANSIFHLVEDKYVMHDLFHDLAEELSSQDCLRVTNAEGKIEIPSTVLHVYLEVNNKNPKLNLSSIGNSSNLRTLILGNSFIDDISEIIPKLSIKFRNLRVLEVWSRGYKTLPIDVGDLRNLRLLNFGKSSIEELPRSVLQLYHLQFLVLPSSVRTLPTKFSNLINLRRIEMYNVNNGSQFSTSRPVLSSVETLPSNLSRFTKLFRILNNSDTVSTLPSIPYLGKLTSLERLDEFHVRTEEGYELHQLGPLKKIGGSLRILNLENVRDKDEAVEARLIEKSKLKCLELIWTESAKTNDLEVIEALQPPPNLESLKIDGYRGSEYPTWLQDCLSIKNINCLRFYNCNALTNLPLNFHQLNHCSELVLENLEALREFSNFSKSLHRLSIIKCPCLIFVCENELEVKVNQSIIESGFFRLTIENHKELLDHELKSFEQTGSKGNCLEQFEIIQSIAHGNAPEQCVDAPEQCVGEIVNKAWWLCHRERMNFIFGGNTEVNKLKLPSTLRILHLGYCCISDVALSGCLRELTMLEELYLWGIMTITTLPPANVLKSLKSLQVVEIKFCLYLRSLGGLHALPRVERFLVEGCWCLKMVEDCWCYMTMLECCVCMGLEQDYCYSENEGFDAPLPSTLQSLIIINCVVPQAILNGDFPCLQNVEIKTCVVPSSLSFHKLTNVVSLKLYQCPDLLSIQGLELCSSINVLHLYLLPNLDVKFIVKSWKVYAGLLCVSSSVMLNKLLSFPDCAPPKTLAIKYCEEEISFEKSNHLQSIKNLYFVGCNTKSLPNSLSDFSTLKEIHFKHCPQISKLPELPASVQKIIITNCPMLRERCQPNGQDWPKIQHIQHKWIE